MPADALTQTLADLAAEPAAAALRDLVARVGAADPGAAAALGGQVRVAGDGLADSVRALGRGSAAVGDQWQGSGAEAFATWLAGFTRAGARTTGTADRIGDELVAVGRTLDAVRDEVARRAAEALAAARAARIAAATGGAVTGGAVTAGFADLAAAEAMAGPTTAAQAAVAQAEGELARAAVTIGALAAGLTAFSTLTVPDAGVMGPGWRPRGAASTGIEAVRNPTIDPHHPPGPHGPGAPVGQGDLIESPGVGPAPAPPPAPHPVLPPGPPGRVGDWIRQATGILADQGVPADRMNPDDIATIIDRESGGNPDAVNGWDSNAAHGTPSQGLMQTIGPTFQAYKLPGHGDIRHPIDNIIAGVRYAIARYGSVSRVPGVVALAHGHHYVGY